MFGRQKWKIERNKVSAELLERFLHNCETSGITPVTPISYEEEKGLILTSPTSYSPTMSGVFFELPKKWTDSQSGWLFRSKHDSEQPITRSEVISFLKELDSKNIPLPYFDKIDTVPALISNRISCINNNEANKNKKLSEILKENPVLFEKSFKEDSPVIPDYTANAVSLHSSFMQPGPGFLYHGEYWFEKGNVTLENISVFIDKKFRLPKDSIDKSPLEVIYLETDRDKTEVIPRQMQFVSGFRYHADSAGAKIENTEESKLFYTPKHTENLEHLEKIVDWLFENNVSQEETKSETIKMGEGVIESPGGEIATD